MKAIGFLIGVLIFVLIIILIIKIDKYKTGRIYELFNNYRIGDLGYLNNKWAEFFNTKYLMCEYGGVIPYGLTFIYYGGIWQLAGASELYFVCENFKGIEKEKPVYISSWNYWRDDFKSMKYIMENHPNLREARKMLKPEDKKPEIINL